MSWHNPFSWFPEDPKVQCGWRMLHIYGNPKDDPYYDFCVWDDMATSKGSKESELVTLDRHIEAGIEQIRLIQGDYATDSFEWSLGEFYKTIWPHVVGLFWEEKQ